MKLPHMVRYHSRLPRRFGHQAVTIGPLMFFEAIPRRPHWRHEYRHVMQWYAGVLVGAALVFAVGLPWWAYLVAPPLLFPASYLIGLWIWGYTSHPAERDARRYALREDR